MNRLYWNSRTGLAGAHYLMSDHTNYIIMTYNTGLGVKCDILDGRTFFTVKSKLKVSYAKRLIKRGIK